MGTSQTYNATIIEALAPYPHRNVFEQEWEHSILSFFEAMGSSPSPTVANHATSADHVHCRSGTAYVWVVETDNDPIPDSIYNNELGFTHDYCSGTVATADQLGRCLGITPATWATGGPVSNPNRTLYRAPRPPRRRL
jgi:hypothetical protein